MDNSAIFNGSRFALVESLAALDYDGEIVICQNENGERFACSSKVWEEHAEIVAPQFLEANVSNKSSTDDKIALFRSLQVVGVSAQTRCQNHNDHPATGGL